MPPEENTVPLGDPNAGGPIVGPGDRMPDVAPRRRSLLVRLLPILIVVVALGGFSGIVGYYYLAGSTSSGTAEAVAPLIKADQRPVRVRPENPGGMDVPHQDKEIYDRVGGSNRGAPPAAAERLLPPPETPMARPQATTPVPAPSGAMASPPPASTMAAVPQRPAGTPPPPQLNVPPPPDVSPPPPSAVTSQAVIPPPATAASPLPAPRPPVTIAPPASFTGAPAPAAVPARPGSSRVVLASVQSENDAQREWQRLQRAHSEALSGMAAEFVRTDLGDRGVFWRIYVGPPEAAPDAQARCTALKQRQVNCFVARP